MPFSMLACTCKTWHLYPMQDCRRLEPKTWSFPSPFVIRLWSNLLEQYPEPSLGLQLVILHPFGYLVGYEGPNSFILSSNHTSALLVPTLIEHNLLLILPCYWNHSYLPFYRITFRPGSKKQQGPGEGSSSFVSGKCFREWLYPWRLLFYFLQGLQ